MTSPIPNPFEELAARLSRLEEILYELRQMIADPENARTGQEKIGGVELAMQMTGLARSTIYNLTSKGQIPHMKRGKRIYFSDRDLFAWIKEGRQNTLGDLEAEVDCFLRKKKLTVNSYKK